MKIRHRRTHAALVVAALCLLPSLTGCSDSGGGYSSSSTPNSSPSAAPRTSASSPAASASGRTGVKITIQNFAFHPAKVEAAPGTKVTVTNQDSTAHTLTADDKSFDTGHIAPGKSATFTAPSKSGAYSYHCTIHPTMHGTLTVR
ncbi:cupredoxin domain-containing protein [Streptomyces sp. NPDC058067]|uniref:cupredoxin domain-containing protein n=1 Tax=Streptomyces sp. NPDC058067 TaxID=3346324 RepID=UPI0036EC7483